MNHDWCFFVILPLTEAEVTRALDGATINFKDVNMTSGHARSAHIGCMTCEQQVSRDLLDTPCPGEPKGYEGGIPVW